MKRNILRAGRSSLAVSIPNKFVELNNLQPGQEVDVMPHGSTLLISFANTRVPLKRVDISELTSYYDLERTIDKIIGALFKQGAERFEITSSDPKKLDIIRSILRKGKLAMYEESTSESKSSILINSSIAKFDETTLEEMVSAIIKQLYRTFEEINEAIESRNLSAGLVDEINSRDKIINDHTDICRRIINNTVFSYKSTTLYNIVDKCEKIGDLLKELVGHCLEDPVKAAQYTRLMRKASSLLQFLFSINSSFSIKKIVQFQQHVAEVDELLKECEDKRIYFCVNMIAMLIKHSYSDIIVRSI